MQRPLVCLVDEGPFLGRHATIVEAGLRVRIQLKMESAGMEAHPHCCRPEPLKSHEANLLPI